MASKQAETTGGDGGRDEEAQLRRTWARPWLGPLCALGAARAPCTSPVMANTRATRTCPPCTCRECATRSGTSILPPYPLLQVPVTPTRPFRDIQDSGESLTCIQYTHESTMSPLWSRLVSWSSSVPSRSPRSSSLRIPRGASAYPPFRCPYSCNASLASIFMESSRFPGNARRYSNKNQDFTFVNFNLTAGQFVPSLAEQTHRPAH